MRLAIFTLFLGLLVTVAQAQNSGSQEPRGKDRLDARQQDDSSLTVEQKAQVKAILSKYDVSSLTAKDARAINDTFRAAGLRNPRQQQRQWQDLYSRRIHTVSPKPFSGI